VRDEFLAIAKREPWRCEVIDATQTPAEMLTAALAAIEART